MNAKFARLSPSFPPCANLRHTPDIAAPSFCIADDPPAATANIRLLPGTTATALSTVLVLGDATNTTADSLQVQLAAATIGIGGLFCRNVPCAKGIDDFGRSSGPRPIGNRRVELVVREISLDQFGSPHCVDHVRRVGVVAHAQRPRSDVRSRVTSRLLRLVACHMALLSYQRPPSDDHAPE
jgi:hypothetical protein